MSHTPGPWRFEYDQNIGMSEHDDAKGTRLIESAADTLLLGTKYYPGTPDNVDDWHLIAAAPELLKALKEVQCPRCEVIFGAHPDYYEVHKCARCEPWRELIAKAEGR